MMPGYWPGSSGAAMNVGILPCLVVTMTSLSNILTPPRFRFPDPAIVALLASRRNGAAYCANGLGGKQMADNEIDGLLGGAVNSGRVAGVVALAASGNGTLYQGAFGRRGLADGT